MDSEKTDSDPRSAGNRARAGLLLMAIFLVVGGFVAWFAMKNAAHNLVGGDKYIQLTANSAAASGSAAVVAERERGFFASEEELAKADPALKKDLLDSAAGAPDAAAAGATAGANRAQNPASRSVYAAAGSGGEGFSGGSGGYAARAGASGFAPGNKLLARVTGLSQFSGGSASNSSGSRPEERAAGISVRSIRSDAGRPVGGLAGAPKTSVIDALKSAFRANLSGARQASHDAARGWIARSFDANPESSYSLGYDERMKTKLDRVNPNSIPKYLREQNLDASGAKSLHIPEVDKPELDADGTREALKGDKNYQDKKDNSQDLAKALFNPIGPFAASGNTDKPAAAGGGDSASPAGEADPGKYDDPAAEQELKTLAKEDYLSAACADNGAACGGTPDHPMCCLPPGYFNQQCSMSDPAAPAGTCAAGAGDFPPVVPMSQ